MERLPDFFDQSPFHLFHQDETFYGEKTMFPVEEFGKVSEFYGDVFPLVYQVKNAVVFHGGAATSAGVVTESSFFEIYRNFMDFRQYIPDYEARFTEIQVCLSDRMADVVVPMAIYAEHLWDSNYQHFFVETLPRIYLLAQLPAYQEFPIIVHDIEFIREIVGVLLPDRVFIYVNPSNKILVTEQLVFCGAVGNNFRHVPDVTIMAFNCLRNSVLERVVEADAESVFSPSLAYVGRRLLPGYFGNKRFIRNTDSLITSLAEYGFHCIDFDQKSIVEKAQILSSAKLAISPIGANLMNFIFSPQDLYLIIINHPLFKGVNFFADIYTRMNFGIKAVEAFDDVAFFEDESGFEASYVVDISMLKERVASQNVARQKV
jgi:hypothetical protein